MIVNKPLQLRGYTVTGKDSRSGKPFSDIIALDTEIIQSGKAWGMKSVDMIETGWGYG